jgi:hypothetical protein
LRILLGVSAIQFQASVYMASNLLPPWMKKMTGFNSHGLGFFTHTFKDKQSSLIIFPPCPVKVA